MALFFNSHHSVGRHTTDLKKLAVLDPFTDSGSTLIGVMVWGANAMIEFHNETS